MASRELEVDLRVYPLTAVLKTAAAFSARCASRITHRSDHQLVVTLTPIAEPIVPNSLETAFLLSLADHAQQELINEQTKDVRLALIRAALAEALKPPANPAP